MRPAISRISHNIAGISSGSLKGFTQGILPTCSYVILMTAPHTLKTVSLFVRTRQTATTIPPSSGRSVFEAERPLLIPSLLS